MKIVQLSDRNPARVYRYTILAAWQDFINHLITCTNSGARIIARSRLWACAWYVGSGIIFTWPPYSSILLSALNFLCRFVIQISDKRLFERQFFLDAFFFHNKIIKRVNAYSFKACTGTGFSASPCLMNGWEKKFKNNSFHKPTSFPRSPQVPINNPVIWGDNCAGDFPAPDSCICTLHGYWSKRQGYQTLRYFTIHLPYLFGAVKPLECYCSGCHFWAPQRKKLFVNLAFNLF